MDQQTNSGNETLLIVDDENDLCDMLTTYLSRQGFTVVTANNAIQARELLSSQTINLMVLDINMPGESGLDLLRTMQMEIKLPVILLTANTDVIDRVVGLELGADDYIGKPFDLRELLARIRSVLRRATHNEHTTHTSEQVVALSTTNFVQFGDCRLDLGTRRLFNALGEELPLTAMEFDLLQVFADNPNRVLTRDRLLELAHCRGRDPFDRSIDIRITRLRRKIESDPAHPQVIKTVRGSGYLYSTHSQREA
jgi:DNA-binding response OmpR family regulator